METTIKAQKLSMKHLMHGCTKVFFFNVPVLETTFITLDSQEILHLIKVNREDLAKEKIKELQCNFSFIKILMMLGEFFSTLSEGDLKDLHPTSQVLADFYTEDGYKELMQDVTLIVTYDMLKKFISLAEEVNNLPGAAYQVALMFFNFFKSLKQYEPLNIKKLREDFEYVFLIQMYLNGSKELPERKTDNFNYALLSEVLKKDDLRVLKSIEDYLDSAENKALGAAGAVAQSIEKEDLEPGVKKAKKDVERIEKLED